MIHESLAEIPEGCLLEKLQGSLFEMRGIPDDVLEFHGVPLPVDAQGKLKGDIDVLLCSHSQPSAATAIQAKRVKVGMKALREGGQPNKLQQVAKGVRQANLLAEMGFWQVYLYILVVVDSREKNAGRVSYEGPPPALREIITRGISIYKKDLNPRVGLVCCEFVQPMDREPLRVGTGSISLERMAKRLTQSDELTKWVKEAIATRIG